MIDKIKINYIINLILIKKDKIEFINLNKKNHFQIKYF